MDYILSQIRENRELTKNQREVVEYLRVEIEYSYVFLLGYLWNQNVEKLDEELRMEVSQKILTPTIGQITEICRTLDNTNEDTNRDFFNDRKARSAINSYPEFRNLVFGHGFLFSEGNEGGQETEKAKQKLTEIVKNLFSGTNILTKEFAIILVQTVSDDFAEGVRLGIVGDRQAWRCSTQTFRFEKDNIYVMEEADRYARLSPFISITQDKQMFMFRNVEDPLTGRTAYNRIGAGQGIYIEWPEFVADISDDGVRRKSINGTVRNVYDNNFGSYIDFGMKKEVIGFLLTDRAHVCGIVWGHGGVGKTAAVQSICEDLCKRAKRPFDYIVFASAKDRAYSYYTGEIVSIDEPIDSYASLVKLINSTIRYSSTTDVEGIRKFPGRLLLVIDDYETYSETDRKEIEKFVGRLDISRHKVLITTRAKITIGKEFATHELDAQDTQKFARAVMRSEHPNHVFKEEEKLSDSEIQQRIYEVTSGRPLFIFQFIHIWAQTGNLAGSISKDIRTQKEAIEFLFGRLFHYLSEEAKFLFRVIGLLVTDSDLTNLVNKLQYITNMENNEDGFRRGLEELEKLKVVEVFETGLFRVYSIEILQRMREEYDSWHPPGMKGGLHQRLNQVTQDNQLDVDRALLRNADAARLGRSEREVIDLYRQVLNRDKSPLPIRSEALRHLGEYLSRYRENPEGAIEAFSSYQHQFPDDALVAENHAYLLWHVGKRADAVQVLKLFFTRSKPSSDSRLDLLGLYLTFWSKLLIDRHQKLTNNHKGASKAFPREIKETTLDMRALFRTLGRPLFERLNEPEVDSVKLSPKAKHNVADGLVQLCKVGMILEEFEFSRQLCQFALDHLVREGASQYKAFQDSLQALSSRPKKLTRPSPQALSSRPKKLTRSEYLGSYKDFQDHSISLTYHLRDLIGDSTNLNAEICQQLEKLVNDQSPYLFQLLNYWRKVGGPENFDEKEILAAIDCLKQLGTACVIIGRHDKAKDVYRFAIDFLVDDNSSQYEEFQNQLDKLKR